MLINKNYNENDVISFKLSTGEEIITRYVRQDSDIYYVTKPTVLMMGQQGMGMMPFMFTVDPDAEYAIPKNNILVHAATDVEIAKQYLSKTSGIVI